MAPRPRSARVSGFRRPTFVIVVAAIANLFALPPLSLAANSSPVHRCSNAGTPAELFLAEISARGVSCAAAKRFIIDINGQHPDVKYRPTHYRGYTCHPRQEGVAAWIRCTRGHREIRWLQGT